VKSPNTCSMELKKLIQSVLGNLETKTSANNYTLTSFENATMLQAQWDIKQLEKMEERYSNPLLYNGALNPDNINEALSVLQEDAPSLPGLNSFTNKEST
jgi:phosphoribosylanthranilate isomerase